MGSAEIVERIKTALDDMPVQMQTAARFVMEQPSEVALLSMREQARKAGVSPAAMTRLAQKIGFSGYQDLKDEYANAIRNNVAWFSGRAENMLSRRQQIGEAALATETIKSITHAVGNLNRPATIEAMIKATDIIEKAKRVFCIGSRSTFPVAFLFEYTQRYFSEKTFLLESPGHSGVDLVHGISSKDALLAVSLSPYSSSTHRAAQFAHDSGAKIIAITDTEFSPVARLANTAILVSTESPSFFDTISPALAAAEVLVAMVASRAGPNVPKRVREHEKRLRDAGAFWTPPKKKQRTSE
jgi:DNA-binding MurR/RpiR family transcriptional regulator